MGRAPLCSMHTTALVRYDLDEPSARLRLVEAAAGAVDLSPEPTRLAALRADRAPRDGHTTKPDSALRLWEGLLHGGWTLVDWFDADGRRFFLAKPHTKRGGLTRGLTQRERQVTVLAASGESNKSISYQLEISPSRVSAVLKAGMAKLGVRSRAQLVMMVRALCAPHSSALSTVSSNVNP